MVMGEIVPLLDWTNLSTNLTDAKLNDFCKKSQTQYGNVAGVCVQPKYVKKIIPLLPKDIQIITVANFPEGNGQLEDVIKTVYRAIMHGADEIDVVIPYKQYEDGSSNHNTLSLLSQLKVLCGAEVKLKAIIEINHLQTKDKILAVCRDCINCKVDFIKTSTGKIPGDLTDSMIETIIFAIKEVEYKAGIKLSGGIKKLSQAENYLELISRNLGTKYLNPELCRIGTSSLLI